LILACNMIEAGLLDVVIAGGTECLTKFHLNGFNTLMILDKRPCRPFDETRTGLNLGEGAAYLVLESEKAMQQRQVKPIAAIAGWGNACDAYHQTASSPDGNGATMAMQQALDMSALKPADIDYISAHGTGTDNNDESEGTAVMNLFGPHVPPISSTKGFTGHTTSAAGSVEMVISLLAMQYRFLPPNLNFIQQMHQLSFKPVEQFTENVTIRHLLNNSFGFGGNNSSIICTNVNY
jgi:3-oxoacyl-(acyl-carrier-protein) synthase